MSYYYNKVLRGKSFNEAVDLVTTELKIEGFGVLTEIDVKETLKKKINVQFKKYKILGVCNPQYAYKALQSEDKIGVFLPCNIVVEENDDDEVELTAVDPVVSMIAVKNESLAKIATEIQQKLRRVIDNVN